MKLISLSCILISSFLIGQCQSQKQTSAEQSKTVKLDDVPYNIHDVDHIVILPRELIEVSGLAYNIEQSTLMLVNDELGYIYEVEKEDGTILTKRKFADVGDYEGIEFLKEDLIVSRSNGKLYLYNPASESTYKTVSYTHLTLPTICSV